MIVSSKTMKPQNVARAPRRGPTTSAACAARSPRSPASRRLGPGGSARPAIRSGAGCPLSASRFSHHSRRPAIASATTVSLGRDNPHDHANLLNIRSSSVAMRAAPRHDHVRATRGARPRALARSRCAAPSTVTGAGVGHSYGTNGGIRGVPYRTACSMTRRRSSDAAAATPSRRGAAAPGTPATAAAGDRAGWREISGLGGNHPGLQEVEPI